MKWTVEFKRTKEIFKNKDKFPLHFKDASGLFDSCYIFLRGNRLFALLNIKDLVGLLPKDDFLMKNLIEAHVDNIVDTVSFRINIPIKIKDIYSGNSKKIKLSLVNACEVSSCKESLREDNKDILTAYRQIKNESNTTLRFLMHYRLLECLAREEKQNVDKLISGQKIRMPMIKDYRNPESTRTLITHVRNKIHATKKSYSFPYGSLSANSNQIEEIVREIIRKITNE